MFLYNWSLDQLYRNIINHKGNIINHKGKSGSIVLNVKIKNE